MRYGILLALGLSTLVVGATCLPIFDLDPPDDPATSTELAVSIITPAEDHEVPAGTVVTVEWTAVNLTESDAIATVLVRHRDSSVETIIGGGVRLPLDPNQGTILWDTEGFEGGAYTIVAQADAGDHTAEATAEGLVTVNTPPAFSFTEPTEDTELVELEIDDPNDPNVADTNLAVTIGWSGFDVNGDGTVEFRIDLDDPYDPDDPNLPDEPDEDLESGDEITIRTETLPTTETERSFEWDGTDDSGVRVEGGDYVLFAVVSDELHDPEIVRNCKPDGSADDADCTLVRITVPPGPFELAFTQPDEDVDFLDPNDGSGDPLEIAFSLDEDEDVTIDFRVDPDDDHDNGNEITIKSRHIVEAGTNEDSFDWGGDDSDDNDVADGIYSLFMAVNRGTGSPQIVEADGLIFLRNDEDKWLIRLLAPAGDVTFQKGGGGNVLIRWEDDDPNDAGESAKIRLIIDDDENLIEGAETGQDPEDVPAASWDDDLLAEPDGALDSLTFFIRDDMAVGRYWIFAVIDRDEVAPFDDEAVAAGQIVIEDPDAP